MSLGVELASRQSEAAPPSVCHGPPTEGRAGYFLAILSRSFWTKYGYPWPGVVSILCDWS